VKYENATWKASFYDLTQAWFQIKYGGTALPRIWRRRVARAEGGRIEAPEEPTTRVGIGADFHRAMVATSPGENTS